MKKLIKIIDKINNLSRRERVMIWMGLLLVPAGFWLQFFVFPKFIELNINSKKKEESIKTIKKLDESLTLASKNLEGSAIGSEVSALNKKKQELENEISQMEQEVVPPDVLIRTLQSMIDQDNGVRIMNIQSVGSVPIEVTLKPEPEPVEKSNPGQKKAAPVKEKPKKAETVMIYKKIFRFELEGRYGDLVKYLRVVENSQWKYHWDHLELIKINDTENKAILHFYVFGMTPNLLSK
ncbi:MAG: hypothetical protein HQL93_03390 [Magnetococcales bacterium]|nr:hypothetical protein [Magnetococcales bacterium]